MPPPPWWAVSGSVPARSRVWGGERAGGHGEGRGHVAAQRSDMQALLAQVLPRPLQALAGAPGADSLGGSPGAEGATRMVVALAVASGPTSCGAKGARVCRRTRRAADNERVGRGSTRAPLHSAASSERGAAAHPCTQHRPSALASDTLLRSRPSGGPPVAAGRLGGWAAVDATAGAPPAAGRQRRERRAARAVTRPNANPGRCWALLQGLAPTPPWTAGPLGQPSPRTLGLGLVKPQQWPVLCVGHCCCCRCWD